MYVHVCMYNVQHAFTSVHVQGYDILTLHLHTYVFLESLPYDSSKHLASPSYKHGIPVAPSPWCSLNTTLMYVRTYQTLIPSIPSFPLQQTTLTTVVTRVHILDREVTHVEWQHDGGNMMVVSRVYSNQGTISPNSTRLGCRYICDSLGLPVYENFNHRYS